MGCNPCGHLPKSCSTNNSARPQRPFLPCLRDCPACLDLHREAAKSLPLPCPSGLSSTAFLSVVRGSSETRIWKMFRTDQYFRHSGGHAESRRACIIRLCDIHLRPVVPIHSRRIEVFSLEILQLDQGPHYRIRKDAGIGVYGVKLLAQRSRAGG